MALPMAYGSTHGFPENTSVKKQNGHVCAAERAPTLSPMQALLPSDRHLGLVGMLSFLPRGLEKAPTHGVSGEPLAL